MLQCLLSVKLQNTSGKSETNVAGIDELGHLIECDVRGFPSVIFTISQSAINSITQAGERILDLIRHSGDSPLPTRRIQRSPNTPVTVKAG